MSKHESMATAMEVQENLDTVLKPYTEYRERAGLDGNGGPEDDDEGDDDDDDQDNDHDHDYHYDNIIDSQNNDNGNHKGSNNHDNNIDNEDNWQEQTIGSSKDEL